MAVAVNADTDLIGTVTNLPSTTNFTALWWSYVVSDAGAAAQSLFWLVSGAVSGPGMLWDGADDVMYILDWVLAAPGSITAFPSRPAAGTWAAHYIRCSGTGAGQLQGGWRAVDSSTWITAAATHTTATPVVLALGPLNLGTPITARFAAAKVWDAVLTDDELLNDSQYYTAVRRANLRKEWPTLDNTDNRDLSGNGYAPTLTSVDTDDGPPIAWAPSARIYTFHPPVVAAAPPSRLMLMGVGI